MLSCSIAKKSSLCSCAWTLLWNQWVAVMSGFRLMVLIFNFDHNNVTSMIKLLSYYNLIQEVSLVAGNTALLLLQFTDNNKYFCTWITLGCQIAHLKIQIFVIFCSKIKLIPKPVMHYLGEGKGRMLVIAINISGSIIVVSLWLFCHTSGQPKLTYCIGLQSWPLVMITEMMFRPTTLLIILIIYWWFNLLG